MLLAQMAETNAYISHGMEQFKLARIKESLADFDHAIALEPKVAPYLWQRGIALYYAGRYDDGRKQFDLHQTVNGNDVENAAWRYLCMARAGTVEVARASILPIEHDSRVPMMQIYALYKGKLRSEEHTSELQSPCNLVCRLLLEKKKK